MKHTLALVLMVFTLSGCVTSAFGLDPYTNLNDPQRVNNSTSSLDLNELERCIHISWTSKQPKFPLSVTYNQNGKVLAHNGILNSRFFAIEISNFVSENSLTMMRASITSDPSMSFSNSIFRKNLIEVLNECGTKSNWTTLL
jgi:hypothetical protein